MSVFMKCVANDPIKLSPEGEFEYMPKTFNNKVTCYRQSGGVILYGIAEGTRDVISESGSPTAINERWIAAQGRESEDGLGGGVWLWDITTSTWEQVSAVGGSARLTEQFIVWEELVNNSLAIKFRKLEGGEVRVLTESGTQPNPFGDLVVWIDWARHDARLHVTKLDGDEV